jgi:hypothetical protein
LLRISAFILMVAVRMLKRLSFLHYIIGVLLFWPVLKFRSDLRTVFFRVLRDIFLWLLLKCWNSCHFPQKFVYGCCPKCKWAVII